MREQIKELCLFMICGQTLLYFQSGKKYEKICRMILELLVLAGIVGMILNFLQSLGIRKGEMLASGGAVAGMQRSMEEALSKQLGSEGMEGDFLSGFSPDSLVEKYTMEEIKSKYNYFAEQYGFTIERVEQKEEKLQVLLKRNYTKEDSLKENDGIDKGAGKDAAEDGESGDAGNPAKIVEIELVEIRKVGLGEGLREMENEAQEKESSEKIQADGKQLESFRRQFALVLAMEEEKLEVILVD